MTIAKNREWHIENLTLALNKCLAELYGDGRAPFSAQEVRKYVEDPEQLFPPRRQSINEILAENPDLEQFLQILRAA